jgi:hypothetical protein
MKEYWIIKNGKGQFYCEGLKFKNDPNTAFVWKSERAAKLSINSLGTKFGKYVFKPVKVSRTTTEIK